MHFPLIFNFFVTLSCFFYLFWPYLLLFLWAVYLAIGKEKMILGHFATITIRFLLFISEHDLGHESFIKERKNLMNHDHDLFRS